MNHYSILEISAQDDFTPLVNLLNDAFGTVALDFGLTRENCPTNSAFISADELRRNLVDRREFFCLYCGDQPAGFIAIEKSAKKVGTFYLEKVAVHPQYRHQGLGERLMAHAEKRVRELGGSRISIALINEHTVLKNWYQTLGYSITGTRDFTHLPFVVCFMEKQLTAKA